MRSKPLHNVAEIQPALAAAGLDAAVVISPRNLWHLTGYPRWRGQRPGYRRSAVAIAYKDSEPTLVTGRYQEEISLMRAWVHDVTSFGDYVESPLWRAADVLTRRQLGRARIGIEGKFLTAVFAADLAKELEGAEIVPCDDLLAQVWAVKQPAELDLMRQNVGKLSAVVASVLAESQAGETESAIHKRILSAIRNAGANEAWGRFISGDRLSLSGAQPSDRTLQAGDLVGIEYTGGFLSYPARVCWMAVVGEPTREQQSSAEQHLRVLQSLLKKVGPGQSGDEIFALVAAELEQQGLAIQLSTAGNAIGPGYYERPVLGVGESLQTKPGMVLSLEPQASTGFKFGVEIEITETGCREIVGESVTLGELMRISA